MYVSLLFWAGLVLPGYVLVRHFWKDELESGLLGVVGLSYLATFALLSPISILCYVGELPLYVLSGACVLAVVVAVIELARKGWWKATFKLLIGGCSAGMLILAIDMVMGVLVGGQTGGDGALHLTRVRQLLDHGLINTDPFVKPAYFFAVYHTGLYHALHAACSQITGVDHVSVWFLSLGWAKLVIAAGAYFLAWSVFDRQWPAWIAAAFVVGCQGPITFIVYPNKIAPFWIVPMMIGFAVRACRSESPWKHAVLLGMGSMVLGQVHSLYGAFVGISLAPVLAYYAFKPLLRRQSPNFAMSACVLALLAALPFLWTSKQKSNAAASNRVQGASSYPEEATSEATKTKSKHFRYFDNGWVMMHAKYGWGIPGSLRAACITGCLLLGIVLALLGDRRREATAFLGFIIVVLLILRIPPLCTLALDVFQREWIVTRFSIFLYLGYIVLAPAAIAYWLEPRTRFAWVRFLLTFGVAASAVPFMGHRIEDYRWATHIKRVQEPAKDRHLHLARTEMIMDFCRKHIEPGSTVLLEDFQGMVLTSIHDCRVVAPKYSGNGIRDIGQRRADLKVLLEANTPWPSRRELLRKYNVKYFFPAAAPRNWIRGHVKQFHKLSRRSALFVLDLDS